MTRTTEEQSPLAGKDASAAAEGSPLPSSDEVKKVIYHLVDLHESELDPLALRIHRFVHRDDQETDGRVTHEQVAEIAGFGRQLQEVAEWLRDVGEKLAATALDDLLAMCHGNHPDPSVNAAGRWDLVRHPERRRFAC